MAVKGKKTQMKKKKGKDKMTKTEKSNLVFMIFVATVSVAALVVASVFASGFIDPILFERTVLDVADLNLVEISPPDWAWYMGFVVAGWLTFYMLFVILTLCRKPKDGKGRMFFRPLSTPASVFLFFSAAVLLGTGWVATWTFKMPIVSLGLIAGAVLTAVIALYLSAHALWKVRVDMVRMGHRCDMVTTVLLGQNGLGLYIPWALFLTVYNLNIDLVKEWDMSGLDSTTIAVSVYGGLAFIYFLIDVIGFRGALRYVLTPYIGFLWALGVVVTREFALGDRNFIITLFLIGLCGFTALFKIAVVLAACSVKEKKDGSLDISDSEPETDLTDTSSDSSSESSDSSSENGSETASSSSGSSSESEKEKEKKRRRKK